MIENEREEGLGFHRMIPIFREKINYINIFRPYEYKKRKRKMLPQKVKETFFFIFILLNMLEILKRLKRRESIALGEEPRLGNT